MKVVCHHCGSSLAADQAPPRESPRESRRSAAAVPLAAPGAKRRRVDPTTCERDYAPVEIEFMKAMDQYKRENRRPFPTWSEVLEVLRCLGYRQVAKATPLPSAAR